MKRIAIYLTAVAAALVPAAVGLWGNASFAHGVDHGVVRPAVAARHTGADDGARHAVKQGRHHHARHTKHVSHAEPGDDHGNHGHHVEAGDDHGHRGGNDDKGSGGHGSDD